MAASSGSTTRHVKRSFPAAAWRRKVLIAASVTVVGLAAALSMAAAAGASGTSRHGPDGLGIQPGKIKHVWLIILENKSYDATFTGLNNNTYLWKTLPAQGVLLKKLLRDRALQPGQLHLNGQRPGDGAGHPGGLPVL